MNYTKIGKFINELRTEANLTQQELADMIPISRQAVSKWERGITIPNPDTLKILSDIFKVHVEEILVGEKINEKNANYINNFILKVLDDFNKSHKYLLISIITIIVLIVFFLLYYFLDNYNSIKVYLINGLSDNIQVSNGIFVVTKKQSYFQIGNIFYDENIKIDKIELYYLNHENKKTSIYSSEDINVLLTDFYGYNAYFDYKNLKQIINNLFLDIEMNKKMETIKLTLTQDFSNDFLLNFKSKKLYDNKYNESELHSVKNGTEAIIVKKFTQTNNSYFFKEKDFEYTYFPSSHILILKNISNLEEWTYNFELDNLVYDQYHQNELINSFLYFNKKIECQIGDCSLAQEKIDFFQDKLLPFQEGT